MDLLCLLLECDGCEAACDISRAGWLKGISCVSYGDQVSVHDMLVGEHQCPTKL